MSAEDLRVRVGGLAASASALSALGLAIERQSTCRSLPIEGATHLDEVLGLLDVGTAVEELAPAAARQLLAEIRVTLHQAAARLERAERSGGWSHSPPALLQAAGEVSAGFPLALQRSLPGLPGLGARLAAPGARFLDVGVGVAVLSIEMARLWPELHIVGIDVLSPALALARGNLAAAGLESRIELREQDVQDLPDVAAFDLAWLPSAFLPGAIIPRALEQIRRSLRPGGWVLLATLNPAADALTAALARLRTAEWGGHPWTTEQAATLLQAHGFTGVATLPSPSSAVMSLVVGQIAG